MLNVDSNPVLLRWPPRKRDSQSLHAAGSLLHLLVGSQFHLEVGSKTSDELHREGLQDPDSAREA
jgi:hypothetical protein